MKTSPAPSGAGLYAFAGLPCTEISAGTAGPLAGLRQGADHKTSKGRDTHFGMPRPEVKEIKSCTVCERTTLRLRHCVCWGLGWSNEAHLYVQGDRQIPSATKDRE